MSGLAFRPERVQLESGKRRKNEAHGMEHFVLDGAGRDELRLCVIRSIGGEQRARRRNGAGADQPENGTGE